MIVGVVNGWHVFFVCFFGSYRREVVAAGRSFLEAPDFELPRQQGKAPVDS